MRKNLVRKISFLFFIALSGQSMVFRLYHVIINNESRYTGSLIFFFVIFATYCLQLRYKIRQLDLLLGCISLLISLYLVLALGDDYFDWQRGEDHYPNPTRYFGLGSAMIFAMNVMSALMIWSDGKVKKEKPV